MKTYYVYMLRCSDGTYYTGITSDLEYRIDQHQHGIHPKSYTYSRRPVEVVYSAWFEDVHEAIAWEHKIKRWRREKKEALIRREWEALIPLSKRKSVQERIRQHKKDMSG